jgi:hypothetical protein
METQEMPRSTRRRHIEWWVLSAWGSLVLVVAAGVTGAAGIG